MIRPAAGLVAVAVIERFEFAERRVALPDAVARCASGRSAGGLGEEKGEREQDQEALHDSSSTG